MELDISNTTVTITSTTNERVNFLSVRTLTTRWMIDFTFLSLCRYFKEENFQEFERALAVLEAFVDGAALRSEQRQKRIVAAFLNRVMHGKHDVQFEEDSEVTPLMSAIKIWTTLKEIVVDGSIFERVTQLLFVQSVAVCLEKGECAMASSVLKRVAEECEVPQNLGSKLSMIVNKRDTYNPFLLHFSWGQLVEMVHTFLVAFLEKYPSDLLLKVASKVVRSSPNLDDSVVEGEWLTSSSSSDDFRESINTSPCNRPRKKLLLTKNTQPWKPDSSKKAVVHLHRLAKQAPTRLTFRRGSPETSQNTAEEKKTMRSRKVRGTWSSETSQNTTEEERPMRSRKFWTPEMDEKLKDGVRRHGEGKWSLMLLNDDFEGRTGVMLKDRWRVLKRLLLDS